MDTQPPRTLIVIPVYNHGATLRRVVEQGLATGLPVLVVDDGSDDGGSETLEGLNVCVLRRERNQGKGAAILRGATEARNLGFTHILTLDADGQHDPAQAPRFLELSAASPLALIVGARDLSGPNVPGASRFGRRFSNFWLRLQTGARLADTQSGFRLYPLALFDHIMPRGGRYEFEVEVLVRAAWAGAELLEIPISVHYPPPSERVSHFRALRDTLRISLTNARLTFRALLPWPHRQMPRNAPALSRRWSSRSLGSRPQHRIFYLLLRLGGRGPAYLLLYFVALYYSLKPSVRRNAGHYLRRRFPGQGPWAQYAHCRRLCLCMGKSLVDKAAAGILGPSRTHVHFPDKQAMLDLLAADTGLVILTAHVGGWQTVMAAMGFQNVAVNVLMHRAEGDVDLPYYELRGEAPPFRIIEAAGYMGGMLEAANRLLAGEAVCLMGDRTVGEDRHTVPVDFLGQGARLPVSACKLASSTGAPVAVLFSHRTGRGRYELELVRVFQVPPGLGRNRGSLAPCVQSFARDLEEYVARHPYQFFNFFNIWE